MSSSPPEGTLIPFPQRKPAQAPARPADPLLTEVMALVPRLRAYAVALSGCSTYADDLVQDVLVRVLRFRSSFVPGTNLRAWLFTILRNTYLTEARVRARWVDDVGGERAARITVEPPQEEWARHRDAMTALQALDPSSRSLLMLAIAGESYEIIAQITGAPAGTVKSRMSRARARLLRILDAQEAALSGGGRPPPCRPQAPASRAPRPVTGAF